MASIRKINGKWRADVRLVGLSKSKRFDTKYEAQAWALELEQAHGKSGGLVQGKTVGDAFRRYMQEETPQRKGQKFERTRLTAFCRDDLANVVLADLKHSDLQRWADARDVKPATVKRELGLIGSVLRTARLKWKWIATEPMRDVRKPKSPPGRERIATKDEIKRILLTLEPYPQFAWAVRLALETAMRQGEIWGLQWENIHLDKRYLRLTDTKNGKPRDVPLSTEAVRIFKEMGVQKKGAVFHGSQASLEVTYRRCVKLAGIEGLTFHDLRHTAITALARKIDVLDLARAVGHRDLRSLMPYYNAPASEIAKRLG